MPFTTFSSAAVKSLFTGIHGRYAHAERLTLGEVELAAGAAVPTHQHPHEQVTYVLAGKLEFFIGDEGCVLEAGMCAVIPANKPHRCRALTAARVLDIFAPVREDYR